MQAPVTGIIDAISVRKGPSSRHINYIVNRSAGTLRTLSSCLEGIVRDLGHDDYPQVYYPESAFTLHPRLRHVMYGSHSPILWSSRRRANLYHFVNRPLFIPSKLKTGFLLEPNDHILSFCNTFQYHRPYNAIRSAVAILDELIDSGLLGLLINTKTGLLEQLSHYLPGYARELVINYDDSRCINMITRDQLVTRQSRIYNPDYHPRVVVMAAGWIIKHLSSIVYAYVARPRKAHLILCVPDLPLELERVLQEGGNSYSVIKDSPLTQSQKKSILSQSDISIALTSVDGGSNALEGIEHGHALITNHYHRSPQFSNMQNAKFCDVGINYYMIGSWGIKWQNVSEYMRDISYLRDPLNREFISNFVDCIDVALSALLEDRESLAKMQFASLDLAINQSIEFSNQNLRNTYMKYGGLSPLL